MCLSFCSDYTIFASITGRDADSETKLKRIEADLKILKLQVCCLLSIFVYFYIL
jgi:hypothetical protein